MASKKTITDFFQRLTGSDAGDVVPVRAMLDQNELARVLQQLVGRGRGLLQVFDEVRASFAVVLAYRY
jgi:hypothetical protein